MAETAFEILLYYQYTDIADPDSLAVSQRQLCQQLNLKGRIIIAKEGINGTLEGEIASTEQYIRQLRSDPRFAGIDMKRSAGIGSAFPKLSVKVRPEIVAGHLNEWDVNPVHTTGKRISPAKLHQWLQSGREIYIIDMRNDYEHAAGHFEGSILPRLGHFRDLPSIIDDISPYRHKTVVTVCTGGVRCEKASGFLIKHGFTDVYQLEGGIVSYMEAYPNQHFKGKLYVFDGRILMGFETDSPDHQTIGRCWHCQQLSEHFHNCHFNDCHRHFICCPNCLADDGQAYCSHACQQQVATMPT